MSDDDQRPELNLVTLPVPALPAESDRELSASDITEAEKVEFVQLVRQGLNRQEAAKALGYRARPWRAITMPSSPFYDEDFANEYADAIGSPGAKLFFVERLREETTRRALNDSDRLLEKLMLVHDPEWVPLRQKDVNVNIHAYIQQHFKGLPTDLLEELLAALDRQADEIVEGEAHELPRGKDQE